MAYVAWATLARQRVMARGGGLDQEALRNLTVGFRHLLYAIVLANVGSEDTRLSGALREAP